MIQRFRSTGAQPPSASSRPVTADVLHSPTTGYTDFANLAADRTCDADATTVEEVADILGTLIKDLKDIGLISA